MKELEEYENEWFFIIVSCQNCDVKYPRCEVCNNYLSLDDLFTCDEKGHTCYNCIQDLIDEESAKKDLEKEAKGK